MHLSFSYQVCIIHQITPIAPLARHETSRNPSASQTYPLHLAHAKDYLSCTPLPVLLLAPRIWKEYPSPRMVASTVPFPQTTALPTFSFSFFAARRRQRRERRRYAQRRLRCLHMGLLRRGTFVMAAAAHRVLHSVSSMMSLMVRRLPARSNTASRCRTNRYQSFGAMCP